MSTDRGTELERDEVERRLSDAARHFEISHDMICTLTFGGRIDRANPAFTRVLGWEVDDLGQGAHGIEPDAFMAKPFDADELLAEVARLIDLG